MQVQQLDGCATVLVSSETAPKVVLASCPPIEDMALALSSSCLEAHDFRARMGSALVQMKKHEQLLLPQGGLKGFSAV